MTPEQKQEIFRRAQMDAQALRAGRPVNNPYSGVADAMEWKRQFDLAVAQSKQ